MALPCNQNCLLCPVLRLPEPSLASASQATVPITFCPAPTPARVLRFPTLPTLYVSVFLCDPVSLPQSPPHVPSCFCGNYTSVFSSLPHTHVRTFSRASKSTPPSTTTNYEPQRALPQALSAPPPGPHSLQTPRVKH